MGIKNHFKFPTVVEIPDNPKLPKPIKVNPNKIKGIIQQLEAKTADNMEALPDFILLLVKNVLKHDSKRSKDGIELLFPIYIEQHEPHRSAYALLKVLKSPGQLLP